MKTLAFIPARGGSETIPLKNLHKLGEKPLLQWSLDVVRQSILIDDIVCSTDHFEIRNLCTREGIQTTDRPSNLSNGKSYPIHEVVIEYINRLEVDPHIVVLIQPTSPFLTLTHLNATIAKLKDNHNLMSVQTICPVPHNYHAWNQRSWDRESGKVKWCFPDMRKIGYNKQSKPEMWKFGNIVATRVDALRQEGCFAEPSFGIPIGPFEAFDVDNEEDFLIAERLLINREFDY